MQLRFTSKPRATARKLMVAALLAGVAMVPAVSSHVLGVRTPVASACSWTSHGQVPISNMGWVAVWSGCGWHTETYSYGSYPTKATIIFYCNAFCGDTQTTQCNSTVCNSPTINPGPDGYQGKGCIWAISSAVWVCNTTPEY